VSRYLILVILNTPLVLLALLNAIVSYKLNHITFRRMIFKIVFWFTVATCLLFTETIYRFLYTNGLTQTEPLSLFDVIQITGVILMFFLVNKLYVKVDVLEKRMQDLHQQLSIRLANDKDRTTDK